MGNKNKLVYKKIFGPEMKKSMKKNTEIRENNEGEKYIKAEPKHGKNLTKNSLNMMTIDEIIIDIYMPVPDYIEIMPPPYDESHDLVTAVNLIQLLGNWVEIVTKHYYLMATRMYDIFSSRGIQQIYGTLE
ncbi:7813_t:CDS:2, partial [Gigaspora rosea]